VVEGTIVVVEPDGDRRAELVAELVSVGEFDAVVGCESLFKAVQSGVIRSRPSMLIINIDTPEMLDMRTWASLRAYLGNRVQVVALSKGESKRALQTALGVGVSGLHATDVEFRRHHQCIRRIFSGDVDFDPGLADKAKEVLMGPLNGEAQFQIGGLNIDLDSRTVSRWGEAIQLSSLEFRLLAYLVRNMGRVVPASELLQAVWGASARRGGTLDQVKGCVKLLRSKIEPIPHTPRYIKSIRGRGYVLRDFLHTSS
jgi:DNA-binding response OmpR family regulator